MKIITTVVTLAALMIASAHSAHPTYDVEWNAAKAAGINITTQGTDSINFFMNAPLEKHRSKLFQVELLVGERNKPFLLTNLAFQEVDEGRGSWQFTISKELRDKARIRIVYGAFAGGETYVIEMKEPTKPSTATK
jgi:hypothetical protein